MVAAPEDAFGVGVGAGDAGADAVGNVTRFPPFVQPVTVRTSKSVQQTHLPIPHSYRIPSGHASDLVA
jgi:hypothetical protein